MTLKKMEGRDQRSSTRWRRRVGTRFGSPPTPLTLGFVFLVAAAAPLSSSLFQPTNAAGETPAVEQVQPVLCFRDTAEASGREAGAPTGHGALPTVTCRKDVPVR